MSFDVGVQLTFAVPLPRPARHRAEGVQEALHGPSPAAQYVLSSYPSASLNAESLPSRAHTVRQLISSEELAVPQNMKLLALPIYELYDNVARYGPVLAGIPSILSR